MIGLAVWIKGYKDGVCVTIGECGQPGTRKRWHDGDICVMDCDDECVVWLYKIYKAKRDALKAYDGIKAEALEKFDCVMSELDYSRHRIETEGGEVPGWRERFKEVLSDYVSDCTEYTDYRN